MMRSPEQQFAMAKRLPIPELAKVLQGQSDVVDMSIAEMVLRQKMQAQKAQQGMAAQAVANGPKVVEQDLMQAQQMSQPAMPQTRMDAGVAGLPADVDVPEYAGGGIVAFDVGGSVGAPLQSTRVPGPGPTFSSAFPNAAATARTASRMPGLFGRIGALASPLLMFDAFTGPTEDEILRLKEFDKAKEYLKNAGFTDKDISALETKDVYRMATGYGYKPATPVGSTTPPKPVPVAPSAADAAAIETPGAPKAPAAAGIASLRAPKLPVPGELTPEQAGKERLDYYAKQGISADPYAKAREALEADRAKDPEARREAGWMRALEAGLGIMGGESPYAMVNIGKGSQAAARGAAEDAKEFRKLERERGKEEARLAIEQNNYLKSGADADLAKVEKRKDTIAAIGLEQAKLEAQFQLKSMELSATKGDRRMASALEAAQRAWKNLPDATKLSGGPGGKPLDEDTFVRDRAAQYLQFLESGAFGASKSAPAVPSGVKVTREK